MGLFEAKQEPRDTYGPMDIDGDESMNRLEHLMLSQEDLDGPARKRGLHVFFFFLFILSLIYRLTQRPHLALEDLFHPVKEPPSDAADTVPVSPLWRAETANARIQRFPLRPFQVLVGPFQPRFV